MAKKYWIDPPQNNALVRVDPDLFTAFAGWFNSIADKLGPDPTMIKTYTVADLPAAPSWGDSSFTSIVGVSDETGGYMLAFSDGTNWKRVSDPSTTIS